MLKAAFFLVVRQWRKHRWLYAATLASSALGVALVVSMDLAIQSSKRAIARLESFEWGEATHRVVAQGRALHDSEVFELLDRGPSGTPVLRANLASDGWGGEVIPLLGVDPFSSHALRGNSAMKLNDKAFDRWWTDSHAVFTSRRILERYKIPEGEALWVRVGSKPAQVRFFSVDLGEGAWAVADIATAQELSGRLGEIDGFYLYVQPGQEESIRSTLPSGLELASLQDALAGKSEMTRSFRFNLFALSLLGLLVAAFLIFSAIHFLVTERLPEFGLLHVLGWTPSALFGMVVFEAILLGGIGAIVGFPLGAMLGHWTVFFVTRTLRDLYGQVYVPMGGFSPSVILTALGLSIIFTVLGAWVPAMRLRKRAALRTTEVAAENGTRWYQRMLLLSVALLIGFFSIQRFAPKTLVMGFGSGLALVGSIALFVPIALWFLFSSLSKRTTGWAISLGARRGLHAMRVTWFGTAALVVALGMTLAISQMVTSFRLALTDWMHQVIHGDVYVSPDDLFSNTHAFVLDPKTVLEVRSLAASGRVETLRTLNTNTSQGSIAIAAVSKTLALGEHAWWRAPTQSDASEQFEKGAVLISEPLARRMGWEDATEVRYETPTGWIQAPLLGIFREYGNAQGVMHLAHDRYVEQWKDPRISGMEITFDRKSDLAAFLANLRASPIANGLKIQTNHDIFDQSLMIFDQTFAVTRSLQWVSLVIAILGVLAAQGARAARSGEESRIFNLLGATRTDRSAMEGVEAIVHAAASGILAVILGTALTWVLIHVIQVRAFGWSFEMSVSWRSWLSTFALAFVGLGIPVLWMGRVPKIREDRE